MASWLLSFFPLGLCQKEAISKLSESLFSPSERLPESAGPVFKVLKPPSVSLAFFPPPSSLF